MAFRKPITTAGGLVWWANVRQDMYFILQEHNVGLPVWPYKYRIIMRENRMEIANSNNWRDIELDWRYLQTHAVPQLDGAIDMGAFLISNADAILRTVLKVISIVP